MKKLRKKYIAIIVLIFLLLFAWAEEVIIGEGYFKNYLHLTTHKILRFSIRGTYALIVFSLGYIGLSNLSLKWIKSLWIYWYVLSFITALIRIVLEFYLSHYFNNNIWEFLGTIYFFSLTPFPYIIFCLINYFFSKMNTKNSVV